MRGVVRGVRGRLSGPKRGPFWWKHPRAKIFWGKSLKKKEVEENEMGLSLNIVYSHPLYSGGFLSLRDVLVYFLRV